MENSIPSFAAKNFTELIDLLDKAIDEIPTEENYIAEGFDEELDEYRSLSQGGKQMLAKICEQEKTKTGVTSLKIKYNRVFGYFFEVPASHADNLPEYFVRRQTLTNVERFITDELKSFESKILYSSKYKELDFKTIDKISNVNSDFKEFINKTHRVLLATDEEGVKERTVSLRSFCDKYFEHEADIEKYCKQKNIPMEIFSEE